MDTEALPYLALLIAVLFLMGLAVTIASTFAGLRVIDRRVRTCPSCGQAGSGQPVADEKAAIIRAGEQGLPHDIPSPAHSSRTTYECENCGHVWSSEIVRRQPRQIER